MQGFTSVSDARLMTIRPWLRVAPGVTASWMLLGTLTQSPFVLGLLVPFALLGAVLPTHPFDVFYNHCARFVLGQPVLPENPVQRRVCCALASGWAIGTALLFHYGLDGAGTVTGLLATTGCALPALTDLCVPSFVMALFGKGAAQCTVPVHHASAEESRSSAWWRSEDLPLPDPVTRTLYVSGGRRGC